MVTDDSPPMVLEGRQAAVDVWGVFLDSGNHYPITLALITVDPFWSAT